MPPQNDATDHDDEIQSDSDYDNPYTETALDWHRRSLHRLARRRCGMYSSSDESLEDSELQTPGEGGNSEDIFDRWTESFPLIAARCSLFMESSVTSSRRRSVRDQEVKSLCRVLRKICIKNNQGRDKDRSNHVSSEEMKYHQLVADSILPKGLGVSFLDAVLARGGIQQPSAAVNGKKQMNTVCRTVLEMVSNYFYSALLLEIFRS